MTALLAVSTMTAVFATPLDPLLTPIDLNPKVLGYAGR
jgi:hypothetical protein